MAHTANTLEINHSDEPIRLFKSDFLEFFTHVSPIVVLIIWVPVALLFMARAISRMPAGGSWVYIPLAFLLGVFIWSLSEYLLHRFFFHYDPRTERMQKIFFLFHGVHHAQPQLKTRLVMPPAVSIPLAILFYLGFWLIAGRILGAPHWVAPLFSGFIVGYLIYDMMHYATHHLPMRLGPLKYLKRYHMQHHFKTPSQRFGVSSPLWDVVFGTKPAEAGSPQRNA